MTTSIETSQIVHVEELTIGDINIIYELMKCPAYHNMEFKQVDNQSNKMFVSETLDDQTLLILATGN